MTLPPAGAGGVHRTQLRKNENIRKTFRNQRDKDISVLFFLAPICGQTEKRQIPQQYQCKMAEIP
jgi:hypothetical protein